MMVKGMAKIRIGLILALLLQVFFPGSWGAWTGSGAAEAAESPESAPAQLQLAPVADAYVNGGGNALVNYGSASLLRVKSSSASADLNRQSYLRFDLTRISGSLNAVKLRVYGAVTDGGGTAVDVQACEVADDQWAENSLTWSSRPEPGPAVSTVNFTKTAQWREFDITEYARRELAGDRSLSLVLLQHAASGLVVDLNSRENGANPPYLLVDYTPFADTQAPAWPADAVLTAEDVTSNRAAISWPPALDETAVIAYHIYRNGEAQATVTAATYRYEASGLVSETDYWFQVEAEDPAGNRSAAGPQILVRTAAAAFDYVWVEGEAPDQVHGDYRVRADAGASGQKLLLLDSTDTATIHRADYTLQVPKTGSYAIWALSSSGSENYVSRYKWRLDSGAYRGAAPLTRISGVYSTGDSRKVPVYWDKLDEAVLAEGSHSFGLQTDVMRELSPPFYYHAWDALVLVPSEWGWTPSRADAKPVDPSKIKAEFQSGVLSAAAVSPEGQLAVSVTHRVTQAAEGSPSLFAELLWKGETVARAIQSPAVPMKDWVVNQSYTDHLTLTVPFTAVASEYEVRTGIVGVSYSNGASSAEVGQVTVGQPAPAVQPVSARILSLSLPSSMDSGAAGQGSATLELSRLSGLEGKAYLSFWQGEALWGITELPALPPGWDSTQAVTVEFPARAPEGLPGGVYQVKLGLHRIVTDHAAPAAAVTVAAGTGGGGPLGYKPLSHGVYRDASTGQAHTWYVNQAHTMIWDGEPFVPVGGMWTSKFLIGFDVNKPEQNKANWQYDLAILQQMKDNGVKDLYVNAVVTGTKLPAWAWQWVIRHLEEAGFTYGLQFNGRADEANANRAYMIRANDAGGSFKVEQVTAGGEVGMSIPVSAVQGFGSPVSTLFLVVDSSTGAAVQAGSGTVGPVASGIFTVKAQVTLPPGGGGPYTVYFTPQITFNGNAMKNVWDGADATLHVLGGLAERLETGPGMRLFVDPIVNESGIVNWYESLLMSTPGFHQQFAAWLEGKYGTASHLGTAWQVTPVPASFDIAAGLVPLHTGRIGSAYEDTLYLLDPPSGELYTSNIREGVMWEDVLAFRDQSFGKVNNKVADGIKQHINAPVIYKHIGLLKRYNINASPAGGFDGLGGEIYGDHPLTLARKSGDVYAAVEQSAKTAWYLVTETQLEENIAHKAASGQVGYPDQTAMHEHFDQLIEAGAKGIYDFLFHAPHDNNIKNYYSYTAKPEEFAWLQNYRNLLLAEARLAQLAEARPEAYTAYAYPAGQMWWFNPTQRTAVLPGGDYRGAGALQASNGQWVLPAYDWNVQTGTLLISLEDDPAVSVCGGPLKAIPDLRSSGRQLVYMGLRKNVGAIPNLDSYFTGETVTLANGDTVQVLLPGATSRVVAATPEGKVWALQDGNLWIVANANWMGKLGSDYMYVRFLTELGILSGS